MSTALFLDVVFVAWVVVSAKDVVTFTFGFVVGFCEGLARELDG